MSELLDNYDTSMIDHIDVTVTCGDTTWTGWHSLEGVAMLGMTIPEVLYKIDLGDPERTARERRILASVVASTAAEPMLTVIRSVNAEEFYQASQGATQTDPMRATFTVSTDGHTLYQRVFLVWPAEGDVHGIHAALPVAGDFMSEEAFDQFRTMIYPEFDYNTELFNSLSDLSKQEMLVATVAYKMMERLINGNKNLVESMGYALPDDEDLGAAQPAWEGALDGLPLPDIESMLDIDEIERFANGG